MVLRRLKLTLKFGDYVSGNGVRLGKYMGTKEYCGKMFDVVHDTVSDINVYFPVSIGGVEKLPDKSKVLKCLGEFSEKKSTLKNLPREGRVKFFKNRYEKSSFEERFNILTDLKYLNQLKKIAPLEKKIFQQLKERLSFEISHVLNCKYEAIYSKLNS